MPKMDEETATTIDVAATSLISQMTLNDSNGHTASSTSRSALDSSLHQFWPLVRQVPHVYITASFQQQHNRFAVFLGSLWLQRPLPFNDHLLCVAI
jgi:hypothetical protein